MFKIMDMVKIVDMVVDIFKVRNRVTVRVKIMVRVRIRIMDRVRIRIMDRVVVRVQIAILVKSRSKSGSKIR